MFGLNTIGNELYDKIKNSKEFCGYEKFILISGLQQMDKTNYEITSPSESDTCKGCANNPRNGGSGVCNCILGSPQIT